MVEEQLGEAFEQHQKKIYRYIFYRVDGDRQLAEDLTQEVFRKALEALQHGQFVSRSDVPPLAWLYEVARNAVIDYWRVHWRVLDFLEETVSGLNGSPSDYAERQERESQLHWAMSQLTEDQLRVVLLKFAGYADPEVASILGKTEGAVKSLQHRALLHLASLYRTDFKELRLEAGLDVEFIMAQLEREVLQMEPTIGERTERAEIRGRLREILGELPWTELLREDLFTTLDRAAEQTGVPKTTLRTRARDGVFVLPEGRRGTPTPIPLLTYVRILVSERLLAEGYPVDLVARVLKDQPDGVFAPPLATAVVQVTVPPEAVAPELDLDGLRPRLQKKLEEVRWRYREVFDQRWDVDELLEAADSLAVLRHARDQLDQIVTELEGLQILPDGFSEEHLDVVLGWITEIWAERETGE